MKKRKTRKLFPEDEALQREIARRVKAGVSLAGLISAALICGGCGDSGCFGVTGDVPREELGAPGKPAPAPQPDNRGSQTERSGLAGEPAPLPIPENRGNQTERPVVTPGKPAPRASNVAKEQQPPIRLLGTPMPPKREK